MHGTKTFWSRRTKISRGNQSELFSWSSQVVRKRESAKDLSRILSLKIMDEWIEKHLEKDFEHINKELLPYLPTRALQKALESPNLLGYVVDSLNHHHLNRYMTSQALSAIDHARFAEIARQHPDLAILALEELDPSAISADIFASCGKEEMKFFLPDLERKNLAGNPSILMNISSAVPDDEHFCKDMDFKKYNRLFWLHNYASDKCMSLITVPEGEVPEEFRKKLRARRIKPPTIDNV